MSTGLLNASIIPVVSPECLHNMNKHLSYRVWQKYMGRNLGNDISPIFEKDQGYDLIWIYGASTSNQPMPF